MSEQTVTGKKVSMRARGDARLTRLVARDLGVRKATARAFTSRVSIKSADAASLSQERNPSELHALPEFFELKGMHEATNLVADAIQAHKKIAVYGDYDADGNTSGAILCQTIADYTGAMPRHYIPWRKQGYGLNIPAIDELHADGVQTLIVTDCGTTSFAEIAHAHALGMEVVVIDHHQPRRQDPLPDWPLVNPSQTGDPYPHKGLCAAGLAYIFSRDLNIRLKQTDRYDIAHKRLSGPLLVAAAIGTVTDVMPLDNPVNRYLVNAGLAEINSRKYPGMNALMDILGLKNVDASDIGFLIGPIFNAAGRMGTPDLSLALLTERDPKKATVLAKEMFHANRERKILTESTAAEAFTKAEAYLAKHPNAPFLMLDDPRWDKGIVGIVASRLKERYGIPVALGAGDASGKGALTYSVRSIPGVNFFKLALNPLLDADEPALLKGGGHAMAAGMTITAEGRDRVCQAIGEALKDSVTQVRKNDRLEYDEPKTLEHFQDPAFVHELYRMLGPVGTGVAAPRFLVKGVQVKRVNHMGPNGQDLDVVLGYPNRSDVILKGGLAFRAAGTPLGNILESEARHAETMDAIIEPFLYVNDRNQLTIAYHIVDTFPPKKVEIDQTIYAGPSNLESQQQEETAPKTPENGKPPRSIDDIFDPENSKKPEVQKALKILYEHHVSLFDTETTGKNAGKEQGTNAISQIAALKVGFNPDTGLYYPEVKDWHVTPHRPTYFAFKALKTKLKDIFYKPWQFEYEIHNQALDVTNLTITRKTPNGDVETMAVDGDEIKNARPFYEIAGEVMDFFKDTVPYAYNAPFDMPVMDTHWKSVAAEDPFKKLDWLKHKAEDAVGWMRGLYEKNFGGPVRERMKENEDTLLEMFRNPAHWHCAMYGALVHLGEARRNRLTHMAERYGIQFSRDEQKHDAFEDIGPLVYMIADQIEHFGGTMDMAGLWQAELRKIHPAFKVAEYTYRTPNNIRMKWDDLTQANREALHACHDGDSVYLEGIGDVTFVRRNHERGTVTLRDVPVPGQLRVTFPTELKNDPKIQAVASFFRSQADVNRYNKNANGRVLDYEFDPVTGDPYFTLLNKTKPENKTVHWLPLLKNFMKWSKVTGQQHQTSEPQHYPLIHYRCFDYSSRGDFTLTFADGSQRVIDSVPLSAFRRSESFITRPEQRAHLEDYLKALRFLDRLEFTGTVAITERGIQISGVQREFGDMTIAVPPTMMVSEFLTQNRDQIKDMLKISGIPMVRGTYMSDTPPETEDNDEVEEEHEAEAEGAGPKAAIRIRTNVKFSPNPMVEMEVSPDLLMLVGRHMDPPQHFEIGKQHLSGIYCEKTDDDDIVRLRGHLEAFKEIGQHVRNAAWLAYRFQTLPSVRASQTRLDEKTETLTLYCSPAARTEDLWVLDRAHVPCHVYHDGEQDRIEINLRPLLHDPYHWYWILSKELNFVKANRKPTQNQVQEPAELKAMAKALSEGRVTAYHTDRDHNAWIDFAGMRNVPVDITSGGNAALLWRTSELQSHVNFPQTVAEIRSDSPPNIAHLLADSVGHNQPYPAGFHETADGRMFLPIPEYHELGQHFKSLSGSYRKALGATSVSAEINPLLDAMRKIVDDPDMQLPNAMPHDEKAARIAELHRHFEALMPQLLAMHQEAIETWRAFKSCNTQDKAFNEVATLDHLRPELIKQAKAFPDNQEIAQHLATVEHYFERLSLAEFKKYRTEIDLIAPQLNKRVRKPEEVDAADGAISPDLLDDQGRSGAIPAIEKAFDYLCGGDKDHFIINNDAPEKPEPPTILPKPRKQDDPQGYERILAQNKAERAAYDEAYTHYREAMAEYRATDHGKLRKEAIADGSLEPMPTPDYTKFDEFQLNREYLELRRSFTNLWKSTKRLHRTLLFSQEITATGMMLDQPAEFDKLRDAADFISNASHTQMMSRLQYWQTRKMIQDVRVVDGGVTFEPTALFKGNVDKCAQELLHMPEFLPHNPVEDATGYPMILSKSSLMHLLEASHELESSQPEKHGLIYFLRLWQSEGKGPLIFTDGLLQRLFNSPVPLKLEDILAKGPDGKWECPEVPRYPLGRVQHAQANEMLEFIRSAFNAKNPALFYTTPQASAYLDRVRRHPDLQKAWANAFPGSQPLSEQPDAALKKTLLAEGDGQKQFLPALRRLKLDTDLDMQSSSHAIMRLNHDAPAMLPVVMYEGDNPRGRMRQPDREDANSMPAPKGYGAVMTTHYFVQQLMGKAESLGAHLLHPEEIDNPKSYHRLTFSRTTPRAHLLTPGRGDAKLAPFDGSRMLSLIPDELWGKSLLKRVERLAGIGEEKATAAIAQAIAVEKMPILQKAASTELEASLFGLCKMSPHMAATRIATLSPEEQETVLAQLDQRAKNNFRDRVTWPETRKELMQALSSEATKVRETLEAAEPATADSLNKPDISEGFGARFSAKYGIKLRQNPEDRQVG